MADFFDRPGSSGQAGDGPSHSRARDRHPQLFLESLAVLFQGQVAVVLQLCGQPLFERRAFYARSAGDRLWLYITGFAAPFEIERSIMGTDTEKIFATYSLGTPPSTAASTLTLRSLEYGFMSRG
jgi:hypothetical protein